MSESGPSSWRTQERSCVILFPNCPFATLTEHHGRMPHAGRQWSSDSLKTLCGVMTPAAGRNQRRCRPFSWALTAIFAWQATQGDHGLIMRERRKTQLAQAEANLAAAKLERDVWVRKVAGLTPSHLDKDALDQRARELLNLADPNEIVVQYGLNDKLF